MKGCVGHDSFLCFAVDKTLSSAKWMDWRLNMCKKCGHIRLIFWCLIVGEAANSFVLLGCLLYQRSPLQGPRNPQVEKTSVHSCSWRKMSLPAYHATKVWHSHWMRIRCRGLLSLGLTFSTRASGLLQNSTVIWCVNHEEGRTTSPAGACPHCHDYSWISVCSALRRWVMTSRGK